MATSYLGSHKWAPRCPLGRLWRQFLAIPWAGLWARRAQNGLHPNWIPCTGKAWALPCPFLACFVGTALPVPKMGTGCPLTTVMVSISRHPTVGTGSPFGAGGTVQPTHGHHSAHRHLKLARKAPNLQQLSRYLCFVAPPCPSFPSLPW